MSADAEEQASSTAKYNRVVLKLSGESFSFPEGGGLDADRVHHIARQCIEVRNLGVELALVVGGGNFIRGAAFQGHGITRTTADFMGMLATVINALALQDVIESQGVETRVMTAVEISEMAEPWIRRRCMRHLEKDRIVILAGGTGNPFFTTDTTAALRASEIGADILLKATKVDGVFSADPMADADAERFDTLGYMEVLSKELKVMDATAITLCMDNRLPILVFNLNVDGNIVRAVKGETIGTLVS